MKLPLHARRNGNGSAPRGKRFLPGFFRISIVGAAAIWSSALCSYGAEYWITNAVTLNTASNAVYSNDTVYVESTNGILTLETNASYGTLQAYYFANLVVTNGGEIVCEGQGVSPYDADAKGVAIVVAGDLSVHTNGTITATGSGFPGGYGPGKGANSLGGTHGGMAYSNTNAVYGSQTAPTTLGSGGRASGGGAIKLDVKSNLLVNGAIKANGNNYINYGGGAGGSVWLTGGGTLSGAGEIQAYGGNGDEIGGGGRIAIDDTVTYAFTGNISPGYNYGGTDAGGSPGTVYLPAAARAAFTILTNQTIIIGGAGEYTFGNLTINGGGTLAMGAACAGEGTNCTVTVTTNLTVHTNGTITATAWGFPAGNGPARGASSATAGLPSGTHGGVGWLNTNAVYGSQTAPTTPGSGARGAGGGAIKLDVRSNLVVNGTIQANGSGGGLYAGAAGGSVWLTGGCTLSGAGEVQAYGGNGGNSGDGGGGGGRIAIDDTVNYDFTGNIRAGYYHGSSGPGGGSAGTVYLPAAARAAFTILTNQTIVIGGLGEYNAFGTLTINGGGALTMSGAMAGEGTNCTVTATNLTVHTNGSITVTGWGFPAGTGPGKGSGSAPHVGATHGGIGYNNTRAVYGSPTTPTSLGSGAKVGGGGALRLVIKNNLIVNGTIQANGNRYTDYGCGAGGSVWIHTYNLAGGGLISANGGTDTYGGGGGRIAIYYRNNTFAGLPEPGLYTNRETISSTVTVKGGINIGTDGPEDGSIFIRPMRLVTTMISTW